MQICLRIPALARTTSLAALLFAGTTGCSAVETDDTLEEATDELSSGRETFVSARRDLRKCGGPTCGGYYVKDANRNGAERYVRTLDVSQLSDLAQAQLANATEMVLRGKLGPVLPALGTRDFLVSEAYRGMPGLTQKPSDTVRTVQVNTAPCVQAPCDAYRTTPLNLAASLTLTRLDTRAVEVSALNARWLRDRIESRSAMVSVTVAVGLGADGRTERIGIASQVFIKLPDTRAACSSAAPFACPAGQILGGEADASSCLVRKSCFTPVTCSKIGQICSPGYAEVLRYQAAGGCPQLVCQPSFLTVCAGPIPDCAAAPPGCGYEGFGCVNGSYTCGSLVCTGPRIPM
jgi:hypothetical protein